MAANLNEKNGNQDLDAYVLANREHVCKLLNVVPADEVALSYDRSYVMDLLKDCVPDGIDVSDLVASFNDAMNAHLNYEYAGTLMDAEAQSVADVVHEFSH